MKIKDVEKIIKKEIEKTINPKIYHTVVFATSYSKFDDFGDDLLIKLVIKNLGLEFFISYEMIMKEIQTNENVISNYIRNRMKNIIKTLKPIVD